MGVINKNRRTIVACRRQFHTATYSCEVFQRVKDPRRFGTASDDHTSSQHHVVSLKSTNQVQTGLIGFTTVFKPQVLACRIKALGRKPQV